MLSYPISSTFTKLNRLHHTNNVHHTKSNEVHQTPTTLIGCHQSSLISYLSTYISTYLFTYLPTYRAWHYSAPACFYLLYKGSLQKKKTEIYWSFTKNQNCIKTCYNVHSTPTLLLHVY